MNAPFLHPHGLPACRILASLLALGLTPALAESLTVSTPPVSLTADAGTAPALAGEKAVAHLRETGSYDSLSAALTAARHAVRAVEGNPGAAWTANAAHGLHGTFDADGLRLTVRTAEEKTFTTRWRLTGLGRDGATAEVPAGDLRHAGTRAEIVRPALGLTEWFANSARGLEHGFTLATRPDGAADAPLRLTVAVTGDLAPVAVRDGQALALRDTETGATILDYAGLKAWDAHGQTLAARMETDPALGSVTFTVADAAATYPLTIDPTFTQQAYLKASNTGVGDEFGRSVAVSGDTVVVGAYQEDSTATGVNGNEADNSADFAGAAYVFTRSGTAWTQQAYLKGSNTGPGDHFGYAVAVSGDTVVVAAPLEDSSATGVNGDQAANSIFASGAAYVFTRSGMAWTQQAYLKASNTGAGDKFGDRVAVSGDTVVVAALLEASNATDVNGNQADNSTTESGAAYVFTRSGTAWTQQAYLKASNTGANDQFGFSVAVSGDTVIVGAFGESSNATGVNGDSANDSARGSGAAYVFTRSGTAWTQQAYLKASNTGSSDHFGYAVGVSGDTVIVTARDEDSPATGIDGDQGNIFSATNAGAAYVFVRSGTEWTQQAYLKASNTGIADNFGWSAAVSGDTVVVAAIGEDSNATGVNGNEADNSAATSGAAYVFTRSAGLWNQHAYLKASNTGASNPNFPTGDVSDQFGYSVAVSGDTVVVGARHEDSNATGVDGNQADNSFFAAGAVYVFTLTDTEMPDAYTVWIANYPAIPPALRAPDADADGDGLPNGIEFFCGLAPDADSHAVATDPSAGNRPTLVLQDGLLGLRLTRSDANIALGSGLAVVPALQVFTEAAGWTTPALDPGAGPVLEYLVPAAANATLARFTVTFP